MKPLVLIYDTETDGFLDKLTRIHSLVVRNAFTKHTLSCAQDANGNTPPGYKSIQEGLDYLATADIRVAHNGIKFDAPTIRKVYPDWQPKPGSKERDTLLLSKLIWPEMRDSDFKEIKRQERRWGKSKFPKRCIGRHSLEAWGFRMGNYKADYKDGFDTWSPAMQDYCEQDVDVLHWLWNLIQKKAYAEEAIELEHRFAEIIFMQEQFGFPFDEKAAVALYQKLSLRRQELEAKMQEVFPPWWVGTPTTVKSTRHVKRPDLGTVTVPRFSEKTGKPLKDYIGPPKETYEEGAVYLKIELREFNPGSRDHIANRLKTIRGWKPREFTDGGKPAVNEEVLSELPYPEAKVLAEYLMVDKRIGQLAEGRQAWLKKVTPEGRIHGRVDTVGAVTRRCTHKDPNLAQVPSIENAKGEVPYGRECRALFTALPGYDLVGADASGLELRNLAHYMGRYDGGAYGKLLLEGDVHTANMEAAGLPGRQQAKVFVYAFLYGAGDAKIGSIVQAGAARGKKLKAQFLEKTPALKRLRDDVSRKAKKFGYLKGLDGGVLRVRHQHAALNTLLQSAGAIVMKKALVLLYDHLSTCGWVFGRDYAFVANIHDEIQAVVRKELVAEYKVFAVQAIRDAGEHFKFRCPLDGDAKEGPNWASTH